MSVWPCPAVSPPCPEVARADRRAAQRGRAITWGLPTETAAPQFDAAPAGSAPRPTQAGSRAAASRGWAWPRCRLSRQSEGNALCLGNSMYCFSLVCESDTRSWDVWKRGKSVETEKIPSRGLGPRTSACGACGLKLRPRRAPFPGAAFTHRVSGAVPCSLLLGARTASHGSREDSEAASDRNAANVTAHRGAGRELLRRPCPDGARAPGLGVQAVPGRRAGSPSRARSALAVGRSASVEVRGET